MKKSKQIVCVLLFLLLFMGSGRETEAQEKESAAEPVTARISKAGISACFMNMESKITKTSKI